MVTILIVEDDENTRKLLTTILKRNGYETHSAAEAQEALDVLDAHSIDLIVLDVMMPGMDGYELTELLRGNNYLLPILVVSAKHLPEDKKKAFIVGTDDYMTKPLDTEEMLLRIKALLRRAQIINERKLFIGSITLDYDALSVERDGQRHVLPQKEFYLLYKLLSYPGRIFTRIQLMDDIWGIGSESLDTTVNVHINRLRRRFERYPEFDIISVRGLGYKAELNL